MEHPGDHLVLRLVQEALAMGLLGLPAVELAWLLAGVSVGLLAWVLAWVMAGALEGLRGHRVQPHCKAMTATQNELQAYLERCRAR